MVHRTLAALLLGLSALLLVACDSETAPPQPVAGAMPASADFGLARHALVICIDTVRADRFYSPVQADALSPWLESAQLYRNASSVSSWTIPAVASVFTGWFPGQHGAGEFKTPIANLEQNLPQILSQQASTLAEILAAQGFGTGAFSGHSWLEANSGLEQGFAQIHSRKGRDYVVERFAQWLPKWQQKRAFGYLHFMEAHDWHLRPREELQQRLSTLSSEQYAGLLGVASAPACQDPDSTICLRNLVYLMGVNDLRIALAEILQLMQSRGLLKDTAVLVFSDHGEEFWEHKHEHMQRGDPRGDTAFRGEYGFGHGHSLYEEMLHVPVLAWLPGVAGSQRPEPVSLVDVMPSMLHWLGLQPATQALPGLPLPTSNTTDSAGWAGRVIYASGLAYGPQAVAARSGPDKAIHYLPLDKTEYFNLMDDPGEHDPQGTRTLTMNFDVMIGDYLELPDALPRTTGEVNAQSLEKLQAIGYLQGVELDEEEQNNDSSPKSDSR